MATPTVAIGVGRGGGGPSALKAVEGTCSSSTLEAAMLGGRGGGPRHGGRWSQRLPSAARAAMGLVLVAAHGLVVVPTLGLVARRRM
jgi:hypothetical protein